MPSPFPRVVIVGAGFAGLHGAPPDGEQVRQVEWFVSPGESRPE